MRPRLPWYCVLALSWVVLAACVALGPENLTVGYATRSPVTAAEWLMTQAGVLVHYLRLCVVPYPLRTVYDWPIVRDVGGALLPGVVVLALLGATLSFWPRRPWWGWLGALFFLLLAPTSSVMPIITEVVAERRVYLPMLAVLVPLVFAADRAARDAALRGARGVGPFVLVAAVLGLCFVTRDRVLVYRDEASFWADASGKRDPQSRSFLSAIILANQGLVLAKQGRAEEANACFDTAVQCATPPDQAVTMYALSLLRRKRHAEAVDVMRQLVATDPTDNAWGVLGVCLTVAHEAERGGRDDPRLAEAEALLRRRLVGSPRDLQCWNALGYVLRVTGRLAAAEDAYRHVTELSLDEVPSYFLRAQLLMGLGRGAEIGPLFDRLLAGRPRDVALRMNLAEMAQRNQDPGTAITMLEQVLAIEPGHAQAAASLQELKARLGR
jgi:tetratricopeptide (TPR) repeat protein